MENTSFSFDGINIAIEAKLSCATQKMRGYIITIDTIPMCCSGDI
jgi:hypothetical protein